MQGPDWWAVLMQVGDAVTTSGATCFGNIPVSTWFLHVLQIEVLLMASTLDILLCHEYSKTGMC